MSLSNTPDLNLCWENAAFQLLVRSIVLRHCLLQVDLCKDDHVSWLFRQHMRWMNSGGTHSAVHMLHLLNKQMQSDLEKFLLDGEQHGTHGFCKRFLSQLLHENPQLKEKVHVDFAHCATCKGHKHQTPTHNSNTCLHIPVKEDQGFVTVLRGHQKPEDPEGFLRKNCSKSSNPPHKGKPMGNPCTQGVHFSLNFQTS